MTPRRDVSTSPQAGDEVVVKGAGTASDLAVRLAEVRARIERACRASGRDPSQVRLLAVSKGKPASDVRAAWEAGQRLFGENYAQELVAKSEELSALDGIEWHFIGALQRNKARQVVERARVVQSVDRIELVRELERRAAALGRTVDVMLEVNVGGEATKAGCPPEGLGALLAEVGSTPHLRAVGLMTIPPDVDEPERARRWFAALRELRDRHAAALGPGELSMGMSHDYEVAIAEGATIVRVGTAIFGARS